MALKQLTIVMLCSLAPAVALAQEPVAASPAALSVVRIERPVLANGRPLAPGTYEIRITDERPTSPSGAPNETQRWVELMAGGTVVAREIAEIDPDESLVPIGTSSAQARPRAVVQLLKEGDFVRISIRDGGMRYLLYLPPASGVQTSPAADAVNE